MTKCNIDEAEDAVFRAYELGNRPLIVKLLDTWPEQHRDGNYWSRLGGTLALEGDTSSAADALRKAREQGEDVRNAMGLLYERLGRPDDAAAQYESLLADNPDDVDALTNLGTLEQKRGRLAAAHRRLEQAFRIDPTVGWAFGALLSEEGLPEDALRAFDSAIDAGENRARLDRALLLKEQLSDEELAREGLASGQSVAAAELILHFTNSGNLGMAERVGRAALAQKDPFAFGPMAAVMQKLGNSEEAQALNSQAIALGDGDYLN